MCDANNTPQWLTELAAKSLQTAIEAIHDADDLVENVREKLVTSRHPPVNSLALATIWTLPVSGAPTNYKFIALNDEIEITKHGTGPFGVMAVCSGLTVQAASGEIVIVSLELSGTVRWWQYDNVRDATVSPGQIVKAGQPIGSVAMSLTLGGYYANHLCDRGRFDPIEFLGTHGVPGVGK